MNTTIRNTALASILFAAASSAAFAAGSANLTVTGTIKPAACDVTFSGGGVIDLGTIAANTLSDTAPTKLAAKNSSFSVTCQSATRVMWTTGDNSAGSANANAGAALSNASKAYFGLGNVGGKNIGAYVITMDQTPAVADGKNVGMIASFDQGKTWAGYTSAIAVNTHGYQGMSWATTGTIAPVAFMTATQPFKVEAAIAKTGELPALTQDVAINGSATITLTYL